MKTVTLFKYGLVNKKTGLLIDDMPFFSRDMARAYKKHRTTKPCNLTITKFKVTYKEIARGQ